MLYSDITLNLALACLYVVLARLGFRTRAKEDLYDAVVFALPHGWLSRIHWDEATDLGKAMRDHLARYDAPAHYLRVTVLFRRPFWREHIEGSFWMSDFAGGCCVYDLGAHLRCEPYGVLGWLLTGNEAERLSRLSDDDLLQEVLGSLPSQLVEGRDLVLEHRVKRWLGAVHARPGELDPVTQPEPREHSGVLIVADYHYDSTINGVLEAAHAALEQMDRLQTSRRQTRGMT
jgi:monoamine oxidase